MNVYMNIYIYIEREREVCIDSHYKKMVLRPRFKNAAIGQKNVAIAPFGL